MTAKTNNFDQVLFPKQRIVFDLLEFDPTVEEVYFGGAAGPGKSYFGCMWQMFRRCKYAGTVGLIGRANFTDLEETTVKTFWRAWDEFGRFNPYGVTCWRNGNTIKFSNESEITLRWVRDIGGRNADPNYGFGSLDLTDFFLDEVTEIPEKVFDILSSRVRFRLVNNKPAILVCSNPAFNWVKHRYIEDANGKPAKLRDYQKVVLASLADNKDKKFVERYQNQIDKLSPAARARLMGSWDFFENDNPFFHAFSDDLVDDYEYQIISDEPLCLSFDFNVSPCTVILAQRSDEFGIMIHRCIEADGGTRGLLRELEPLELLDHPAGLIVTGDVSGHARHSSSAGTEFGDLQTDYGIIKKKLRLSNRSIRHTAHQNPRHVYSRRVCNYAMERGVIRFSRAGCGALIQEIKNAIPTKNGQLYKDRDKGHPNDRVDAFRYLMNLMFPKGFKSINQFAEMIGLGSLPDVGDEFDSIREYQDGK